MFPSIHASAAVARKKAGGGAATAVAGARSPAAAPAAAGAAGSPWQAHTDPGTGQTYYYVSQERSLSSRRSCCGEAVPWPLQHPPVTTCSLSCVVSTARPLSTTRCVRPAFPHCRMLPLARPRGRCPHERNALAANVVRLSVRLPPSILSPSRARAACAAPRALAACRSCRCALEFSLSPSLLSSVARLCRLGRLGAAVSTWSGLQLLPPMPQPMPKRDACLSANEVHSRPAELSGSCCIRCQIAVREAVSLSVCRLCMRLVSGGPCYARPWPLTERCQLATVL